MSGRKYIIIHVEEERKNEKGERENTRTQTDAHRTMVHLLFVLPSRADHKSIGSLNTNPRAATRRHVPEGSSVPPTHRYNAVRIIPATGSPLFRETAAAVLRAPRAVLEVK